MSILFALLPYLLSAGISVWIGVEAWRRRNVRGAAQFTGLILFEAIWTLAYLGQRMSPDLDGKLLWNNLQFIGAVGVPWLYLAFALEFAPPLARTGRVSWKWLSPLAAGMLLFIWSDGWHGLFRSDPHLLAGQPFDFLVWADGPLFGLYIVYAYSLIVLTTLILVVRFLAAPKLYRLQVGLVLFGILIPWVTSVITAMHLVPVGLHEITPITFGISNLVVAFALFRYHMFELLPVARDLLIERMEDGLLVLDAQLRILDLNPAASAILGKTASQAIGRSVKDVLTVPTTWFSDLAAGIFTRVEAMIPAGGDIRPFEVRAASVGEHAGKPTLILLTLRDIRERREVEARLMHLARVDPLTGVYNRGYIFERARQAIETAEREFQPLALILFDIDFFKQVNDTCGHLVGDQALTGLVMQLRGALRPCDILGRYGGDEFLVLLPNTTPEQAAQIAERVRTGIDGQLWPDRPPALELTLSAGVVGLSRDKQLSLDHLLECADAALYQAKSQGRNRVVVWQPEGAPLQSAA